MQLKNLKKCNADLAQIRFVAKLLRSKLRDCSQQHNVSIGHEKQVETNFWGYVKSYFKSSTSSSPSFDISACTRYFQDFFRPINPSKCFKIPDWIPPLADASKPYDSSPPSYHQITEVIRRMKASGSPFPIDKISITPLSDALIFDLISQSSSTSFGNLVKFHVYGKRHALSSHTRRVIHQVLLTLGLSCLKVFLSTYLLPVYVIQCLHS